MLYFRGDNFVIRVVDITAPYLSLEPETLKRKSILETLKLLDVTPEIYKLCLNQSSITIDTISHPHEEFDFKYERTYSSPLLSVDLFSDFEPSDTLNDEFEALCYYGEDRHSVKITDQLKAIDSPVEALVHYHADNFRLEVCIKDEDLINTVLRHTRLMVEDDVIQPQYPAILHAKKYLLSTDGIFTLEQLEGIESRDKRLEEGFANVFSRWGVSDWRGLLMCPYEDKQFKEDVTLDMGKYVVTAFADENPESLLEYWKD